MRAACNQVRLPTPTPATSSKAPPSPSITLAVDAAANTAAHDAIVSGFDAVTPSATTNARFGVASSSPVSPPSRIRNALHSVRRAEVRRARPRRPRRATSRTGLNVRIPAAPRRAGRRVQRVDDRDAGADREADGHPVAQRRADREQRHRPELSGNGGAEAEPDQQRSDHALTLPARAACERRAAPPPDTHAAPGRAEQEKRQPEPRRPRRELGRGTRTRRASARRRETRGATTRGAAPRRAALTRGARPAARRVARRAGSRARRARAARRGATRALRAAGRLARARPAPVGGAAAGEERQRVDVGEAVARAADAEVQARVALVAADVPSARPRRCARRRATAIVASGRWVTRHAPQRSVTTPLRAHATRPAQAARTGAPGGAAKSAPRWRPAANGSRSVGERARDVPRDRRHERHDGERRWRARAGTVWGGRARLRGVTQKCREEGAVSLQCARMAGVLTAS